MPPQAGECAGFETACGGVWEVLFKYWVCEFDAVLGVDIVVGMLWPCRRRFVRLGKGREGHEVVKKRVHCQSQGTIEDV